MALHLNRGIVDIVAEDLDIRQALDELFLQMNVQYEMPPEVQGTVTVNLHNATFQQALALILGHEFTYTIGPHDVIYIHRSGTSWKPGNEKIA